MPTVLTVQGVELDVSAADWDPVRLGAVARSFSGAVRSSVRATKRDHRFRGDVGGVAVTMAEIVRALVEGDGHAWSFDDPSTAESLVVSSKGLTPYETGAVSDVAGKYGTGCQFDFGEAPTKWAVGLDETACTLMFWLKESGVWHHYLIRRQGVGPTINVWRDTVQTDSDPGFIYVTSGGDLVADPESSATFHADDPVALPYAVPDAWVAGLYAFRALSAWAPLPYVTADGAAFRGARCSASGQVGTAQRVPLRSSGSPVLGEVLDFTLMER